MKEGTLIATVDIGMTTNTGYRTRRWQDIKPFRFENMRKEFEKFLHMIVASKNKFCCTEVMVGYESTGPYAVPPAPRAEHELSERAHEVASQAEGMSGLIRATPHL